MSRTDVHRPEWVQALDPTVRRWFSDYHDHRNGVCDYEESLGKDGRNRWFGCGRWVNGASPNLWGCCQHDVEHGRVRASWRKIRNKLLKTEYEDLEDVDTYSRMEYSSYWW